MENILQGLPGVSVYINDILVIGKTIKEHPQPQGHPHSTRGVWYQAKAKQVLLPPPVCRISSAPHLSQWSSPNTKGGGSCPEGTHIKGCITMQILSGSSKLLQQVCCLISQAVLLHSISSYHQVVLGHCSTEGLCRGQKAPHI